jgi:acetyl-CoA acetyltransferase family protein
MHIPVYLCDAIRTPFSHQGGALSSLKLDEFGALPIMALMVRNPHIDWEQLSDVLCGCAHPAVQDSANLARQISLMAELPASITAAMTGRFLGSGLEAIGAAARFIKSGEASMIIAGGIDSMSQLPFSTIESAVDKLGTPAGSADRFSMTQSMEKLVQEFGIDRRSQDRFAYSSHRKAYAAQQNGYFEAELTPVTVASKDGDPAILTQDEITARISATTLAGMEAVVADGGTISTGNSASAADGAGALLLACENVAHKYSLLPKARVLGMAVAGVPDDAMGIAPASAGRKVLVQTGLSMEEMAVIELDEMYAAQAIAVLRDWGLQDDDPRVNQNGGAIAFGHPPGATGTRMAMTAMYLLHRKKERYALCVMYAGAGQGMAMVIERV